MGAKVSPEMKEALRLIIKEGYSAYRAAKTTGLSRSGISMNQTYRDWKAKQEKDPKK